MNSIQFDPEFVLPIATTTLRFADTQEVLIGTLDAYISRIEEQSYGARTPEVGQWVTELRGLRGDLAHATRDLRSQGKRLGKLAKQPALGTVLHLLDMVLREEAPGTATHEQLCRARQAVEDGLVSKPIPKPTDNA